MRAAKMNHAGKRYLSSLIVLGLLTGSCSSGNHVGGAPGSSPVSRSGGAAVPASPTTATFTIVIPGPGSKLKAQYVSPNTGSIAISTNGGAPVITNVNDSNCPAVVDAVGPYTVTTLAGSTAGFADGNGAAALFNGPIGMAVDSSGNLYVGDGSDNSRIRKISPAGVVTTLAGKGTPGFADGTGTDAQFWQPEGVAVDAGGNIYVGDSNNNRVRKITFPPGTTNFLNAGVVTTFAGNGPSNAQSGYADGIGTAALFNPPAGMSLDSNGNLYVADILNRRIRKITPAGVVTTVAGNGTQGFADGMAMAAAFNNPQSVAVDSTGTLYVADNGNYRVRKITPAGVVTTLAGSGAAGFADGPGASAQFNGLYGIAVDSGNNVYVTDAFNSRVRKITPAGVVITIAGNGTAGFADGAGTNAKFNFPYNVAVDSSANVYVTDANNYRIRKLTPQSVNITRTCTITVPALAGQDTFVVNLYQGSDGSGARLAGGSVTTTLTLNHQDNLIPIVLNGVVAALQINAQTTTPAIGTAQDIPVTVTALDASGAAIIGSYEQQISLALTATGPSTAAGSILGTFSVGTGPIAIAVDGSGNAWVANQGNNNVSKLSPTGTTLGTYSVGTGPDGIAIDSSGNAWVANQGSNNVTKLSPTGTNLGTFSVGAYASAVAIDSSGNAWVTTGVSNVTKLKNDGTNLGTFSAGTGAGAIAIDGSDNVWVANYNSNNVTKLKNDGTNLGTFSVGTGVAGIAIDSSGNVWTTGVDSHNVTKLKNDGTNLGTFSAGTNPRSIAIDNGGNAWVTDTGGSDNKVMLLSPTGSILGTFTVGSDPYGVAIDRNNPFVWVANRLSNTVTKLSTGTPAATGMTLSTTALPASTTTVSVHYDGTGTGSSQVCASAPGVAQVCSTITPT